MPIRRMAALLLAGLLLGVVSWSLARAGGAESADPTPTPRSAPQTAPGAGGTTPDAGSPAPGASSPGRPGHAARGGRHVTSEILPSPSSAPSRATGLPGLKAHSTTAPLVPSPLPRPASGTGTLAVGFPGVLMPPDRDTIAVSSVTGSDGVLQASLTASCRRPCDPLRRYRVRLAARGFAEIAVPSVENRPTAALQRGSDSVTVSLTSDEGSKKVEYALLAVLHAGG